MDNLASVIATLIQLTISENTPSSIATQVLPTSVAERALLVGHVTIYKSSCVKNMTDRRGWSISGLRSLRLPNHAISNAESSHLEKDMSHS